MFYSPIIIIVIIIIYTRERIVQSNGFKILTINVYSGGNNNY